MRCGIINPGN